MIVGLGLHLNPFVGYGDGILERSSYYLSSANLSLYGEWGTLTLQYGRFLEGPSPTAEACFSTGVRYLSASYGREMGRLTPFVGLIYGQTTMECTPEALSSLSYDGQGTIDAFNGNEGRTSIFGGGLGVVLGLGDFGPFSFSLVGRVAYYPKVPVYRMDLYEAEDGLRGTIRHHEDRTNVVKTSLSLRAEETFRVEGARPSGVGMRLFAGGMLSPYARFRGGYFGVDMGRIALMSVFGTARLPGYTPVGEIYALYDFRWLSAGVGMGKWGDGGTVLSLVGRKVLRWRFLEVGAIGGLRYLPDSRRLKPILGVGVGFGMGGGK